MPSGCKREYVYNTSFFAWCLIKPCTTCTLRRQNLVHNSILSKHVSLSTGGQNFVVLTLKWYWFVGCYDNKLWAECVGRRWGSVTTWNTGSKPSRCTDDGRWKWNVNSLTGKSPTCVTTVFPTKPPLSKTKQNYSQKCQFYHAIVRLKKTYH